MLAKDRHKLNLLKYLGDWENNFPKRIQMHGILGIKRATLRKHFSPDDLAEIENEGLELRKKNSAVPRAKVYSSSGNVSAQKESLDRTEGKVTDKLEATGKGGGPIEIISAIPEPKGEEKSQ